MGEPWRREVSTAAGLAPVFEEDMVRFEQWSNGLVDGRDWLQLGILGRSGRVLMKDMKVGESLDSVGGRRVKLMEVGQVGQVGQRGLD